MVTALVEDAIGLKIRNPSPAAGVDTSLILWFNTEGDGSRFSTDQKGKLLNNITFTYVGKGVLPSDTLDYRAHTAGREVRPGEVVWDDLFDS